MTFEYSDDKASTAASAVTDKISDSSPVATDACSGSTTLGGKVVAASSLFTCIGGAHVKLLLGNDSTVAETIAAEDGSYVFHNLAAGTYRISVDKNGYLPYTSGSFPLAENTRYKLAIPLVSGEKTSVTKIRGIVTDSITHTPIANATVSLASVADGKTAEVSSTNTNAAGQYIFYNIPLGNYTLTAKKTGYSKNSLKTTLRESLVQNAGMRLVYNLSSAGSVVSGFVGTSENAPISGAAVALYRVQDGTETLVAVTFTNQTGRYIFGSVAAGTYVVKSKLSAYV